MAKLDVFLGSLKGGEDFLLETNKEPSVRSGKEVYPVINQTLTTQNIHSLVGEIIPVSSKEELKAAETTVFDYNLEEISFKVTVLRRDELIRVLVSRPVEALDSDETKAAPSVTTAERETKPSPFEAAQEAGEPEINGLLRKMAWEGASDLHISSGSHPLLRIDGDLKLLNDLPLMESDRIKELIFSIMPPQNIKELDESFDTDFPYEIEGLARFRCNAFVDRNGVGAVIRFIPAEILTAEDLGLSKEILDLCLLKKGLVVVTGPTGSGKSTTLCAMIDYINRRRNLHIITIEDPVEFVHENKGCLINQREVNVHTMSFANALRAALREDPDIILVGEMRDLETVSIAIETAETGHLVLATLHTTTAASTVDRMIDQFPGDRQGQIRSMLASSLKGVIAQSLCKKIGGGRVAAFEKLMVNSAVSNLIRDGKVYQIPSIIQTSKGIGMELLNDALLRLVTDKVISPDEAFLNAGDKGGMVTLLKGKGFEITNTNSSMMLEY